MMIRVVRWIEPLGDGSHGSYTCEAKAEDIINYMKNEYQQQFKDHPRFPYKDDEDALEDFCAIHWAEVDE